MLHNAVDAYTARLKLTVNTEHLQPGIKPYSVQLQSPMTGTKQI